MGIVTKIFKWLIDKSAEFIIFGGGTSLTFKFAKDSLKMEGFFSSPLFIWLLSVFVGMVLWQWSVFIRGKKTKKNEKFPETFIEYKISDSMRTLSKKNICTDFNDTIVTKPDGKKEMIMFFSFHKGHPRGTNLKIDNFDKNTIGLTALRRDSHWILMKLTFVKQIEPGFHFKLTWYPNES
jgi:hypothetical protein